MREEGGEMEHEQCPGLLVHVGVAGAYREEDGRREEVVEIVANELLGLDIMRAE